MKKKIFDHLSITSFIFLLILFNISIALAEPPGGGSDPDCSSGGPGATTCTVSYAAGGGGGGVNGNGEVSCSVACTDGYYACCSIDWMFPFVHCNCKSGVGGGGATTG